MWVSWIGVGIALRLVRHVRAQSCVDLPEVTGYIWHGYLPNIGPGQRYGYRVYGPYAPASGHRFNPAKLLIDPYAKAIEGPILWQNGP